MDTNRDTSRDRLGALLDGMIRMISAKQGRPIGEVMLSLSQGSE